MQATPESADYAGFSVIHNWIFLWLRKGPNIEQTIAFLMKLNFRVKPKNDLLRQKCKIIELFFRPGRSGRPSLWSACLVRFSG